MAKPQRKPISVARAKRALNSGSVEEVKAVINDFFSDKSRSRDETRDGLRELIDECHDLISVLDEDQRHEDAE